MDNTPTLIAASPAAIFAVVENVAARRSAVRARCVSRLGLLPRFAAHDGLLDIAAAAMLADPTLRGWGLVLAAVLVFGSVVTMLNHRQHVGAVSAILMMASLVPATLAIPRASQVQFIATGSPQLADTR